MLEPTILRLRQELANDSNVLVERLIDEAARLEHAGTPPSAELQQQLARFINLRTEYHAELAAEQSRQHEAEQARAAALEARREQCEAACHLISQFLLVRAKDELPTLVLEQTHAAEALADLQQVEPECSPEVIEALRTGQHPWSQLVLLVREGSTLSDTEWVRVTGVIRESFSPELVGAALRGRLKIVEPASASQPQAIVSGHDVGAASDSVTASTSADAQEQTEVFGSAETDVVRDEVIDSISTAPSALTSADSSTQRTLNDLTESGDELDLTTGGSIFDDGPEDAPVSSPKPPRAIAVSPLVELADDESQYALFDSDDEDEADSAVLKRPHRFEDPQGESAEIAREIIDGDLFTRGRLLPDLILALIYEGRSGIACHLARSVEELRHPTRPFFPAWLIRAWTLGNVIMFPQGQLVGKLQEDFANRTSQLMPWPQEFRLAYELFLRAAALRAAIVAPATGAAAILRSFPMTADDPQLYNYCSRVGSYAVKLDGVVPTSLKRTNIDQREALLAELQQDLQKWLRETEAYSVRYSVTQPLFNRAHWSLRAGTTLRHPVETQNWQRWQEALQTAERLIRNIISNNEDAIGETRQEMERVAALVSQDRRSPSIIANPEIRTFLLQAVTFGQRWVALNGGSTESFAPDELRELRAEINARHDAVVAELEQLSSRYDTPEVRAAAGCLVLSMEQLRNLVDPDVPVEGVEPDARHLLHAELLRIPGQHLATNWQPQADPETLIDTILSYLRCPQPSWITAIQLQLAADNLDAAEKIASLPVFTASDRRQLQPVLARFRKRQQQELWQDLQETESMIEDASRMQIFSEQDRAGFAARLERLRRGLSLSRDHSSEVEEIYKLRQAVERRRAREAAVVRERLEQLQKKSPPALDRPAPPLDEWKMDFGD